MQVFTPGFPSLPNLPQVFQYQLAQYNNLFTALINPFLSHSYSLLLHHLHFHSLLLYILQFTTSSHSFIHHYPHATIHNSPWHFHSPILLKLPFAISPNLPIHYPPFNSNYHSSLHYYLLFFLKILFIILSHIPFKTLTHTLIHHSLSVSHSPLLLKHNPIHY